MKSVKKYAVPDSEINTLLQELMGISVPTEPTNQTTNNPSATYQLPIRVGKTGHFIAEGDKPWIVGTFAPNQYLNETHPQGHQGVDLKAPKGTPVYPIAPGIVTETSNTPKGGLNLKVTHEDGHVVSYYAHLSSIAVTKGQTVDLNTAIGAVGDTGNAKGRGAHLHYEVKVDGYKIDPASVTNKPVGSLSRQKKAEIYLDLLKVLNTISL